MQALTFSQWCCQRFKLMSLNEDRHYMTDLSETSAGMKEVNDTQIFNTDMLH